MAGQLPIKFQEHLQVKKYSLFNSLFNSMFIFSYKILVLMSQISDLVHLQWNPINLFVYVKKSMIQLL
jgi:hypothetical protein